MGQLLALVKSLSWLQLQPLFVVEKLHMFFTSVVKLITDYSKTGYVSVSPVGSLVLFNKVLAGGVTVQVASHLGIPLYIY